MNLKIIKKYYMKLMTYQVMSNDCRKLNKISNFRDYLTRLIENYNINKSNNVDLLKYLDKMIDNFYQHITSDSNLDVSVILNNMEQKINYDLDSDDLDTDELYNRDDVEFVDDSSDEDNSLASVVPIIDNSLENQQNVTPINPQNVTSLNPDAIKRLNMFINREFELDKILLWKNNKNFKNNLDNFVKNTKFY